MGKLHVEIDRTEYGYPEEPRFLAEWALGDVAERRPAKRQRQPLSGMWISRQGSNLGVRGSDQIERNYVAAVALLSAGLSMKEAVSDIAAHLGKTTAREREVLRTGIYRFRSPFKKQLLRMWLGSFRNWTDWASAASRQNLDFVADQFRSRGKPRQAKQFLELVTKLQTKAVVLGRQSLYRNATWYEHTERAYQERIVVAERELGTGPDQHFVGMALINLARLYHEQRKFVEAIPVYERATFCYKAARITVELRVLMVDWIAGEIERCRQAAVPGPFPVYSGPWVPKPTEPSRFE